MIEINLLPGSQGKSKRGGGVDLGAMLGSVGQHLGDKYLLTTAAVGIVALAAIAGMYVMQSRKEHLVGERQIAAARDSARFSAVLIDRNRAEARRDSVYQQLAIIKSIDDTRFVWPHILEEVNLALPQYTWLTELTQTSAVTTTAGGDSDTSAAGPKADSAAKAANAKDSARQLIQRRRARADSLFRGVANSTKFRIVGQTVDIQALTLFMKNLEASPFIKNVQLTRSDLVTTDNKEVTQFQLEAETEPPAPGMIETVPLSVAVH
jgi:Tfp pilus assembly protein PilN